MMLAPVFFLVMPVSVRGPIIILSDRLTIMLSAVLHINKLDSHFTLYLVFKAGYCIWEILPVGPFLC